MSIGCMTTSAWLSCIVRPGVRRPCALWNAQMMFCKLCACAQCDRTSEPSPVATAWPACAYHPKIPMHQVMHPHSLCVVHSGLEDCAQKLWPARRRVLILLHLCKLLHLRKSALHRCKIHAILPGGLACTQPFWPRWSAPGHGLGAGDIWGCKQEKPTTGTPKHTQYTGTEFAPSSRLLPSLLTA
jgi:hypothetical protein